MRVFFIPAIDIKDGRCVRVAQGDLATAKTYYQDPEHAAAILADAGASWIHVVDLDAAVSGEAVNRAAVERIAKRPGIHIELGGGIRALESADRWFDVGVERVVVGTRAAREPDVVLEWIRERPGRICVGIDARDGFVAVHGWTDVTAVRAVDLAKRFDVPELAAAIYTDIARDGMQTGVNIAATRELAAAISAPVIASGGLGGIEDLRVLARTPERNIVGVISGRAVYEGSIDLAEAFTVRREVA